MGKKKAAKKASPNKGGRPRKIEGQRLDKPLAVVFSDEQAEYVRKAAEKAGKSRAELIRDASLEEAKRIFESDGSDSKRKPSG